MITDSKRETTAFPAKILHLPLLGSSVPVVSTTGKVQDESYVGIGRTRPESITYWT